VPEVVRGRWRVARNKEKARMGRESCQEEERGIEKSGGKLGPLNCDH
jgi:hypothetical protein